MREPILPNDRNLSLRGLHRFSVNIQSSSPNIFSIPRLVDIYIYIYLVRTMRQNNVSRIVGHAVFSSFAASDLTSRS